MATFVIDRSRSRNWYGRLGILRHRHHHCQDSYDLGCKFDRIELWERLRNIDLGTAPVDFFILGRNSRMDLTLARAYKLLRRIEVDRWIFRLI